MDLRSSRATSRTSRFRRSPIVATSGLTWTDLGQNATIAAQTSAQGRKVRGLMWYDGKLWLGYGDYTLNTGPVDAIYWDGAAYQLAYNDHASEANSELRYGKGDLWYTTVDPRGAQNDYVRCTGTSCVQVDRAVPDVVHLYDLYAHSDGSLYLAGADIGLPDGGAVWRSTDDGATWTRVTFHDGHDRCYGVTFFAGYFWTQAYLVSTGDTTNAFRSTDGITWADAGFKLAPNTQVFFRPTVFNSKIVFQDWESSPSSKIRVFDGTVVAPIATIPDLPGDAGSDSYNDHCVADGYCWVIRDEVPGDQAVWRTSDLATWTRMGTFSPSTGASIAVYDGTIYIGTTDSRVYKTTYGSPAGTVLVDARQQQLVDANGNFVIA